MNGRNKASAPRVVVAAPAGETPRNEDPNNITVQHKNNHFRKRALSTATSGTAGSNGNGFDNGESLGALSTSGISLLANSLNPMPSNGIGSGGEGSIVSFGLNFNFDSTSSPSNSDSGEGEKGEGKEGSDGENNKAEEYKPKASAVEVNGAGQKPKKTSNGSGSERSNKDKVKQDGDGSPPSANNNKENSESASDSGQDQDYNSGGSAASGSGNDGSSGGKSTISSLTTSSNQEWMASQNKEAKQAGVGEGASSKKIGEGALIMITCSTFCFRLILNSHSSLPLLYLIIVLSMLCSSNSFADGNRPKAIPKEGAAANGKKRKKISQGNVAGNDEDSTGGYNTDEEQWGGKINNKADGAVGNPIVHKQHHVVTTNTGNSDPSSLTDSNIVHQSKGGPPLKQARFSIDQTPHPRAVPSAETSAQMGLSSLSSDTPTPNAAFANGRIPLPSLTSAAQISASNPSAQAPTIAAAPKPRAKRGASGKHHSATLDPKKREERNAREKERSCRIAKQIDELRSLLSRGGVIVAKGTKSSVLAEAANYINLLQQQQVQWEMDRQAMLQQMQEVGANPSSVHSQSQLPQSMQHMDPNGMIMGQQQMAPAVPPSNPNAFNAIEPNDYQFVFNNSSVGMVSYIYISCMKRRFEV